MVDRRSLSSILVAGLVATACAGMDVSAQTMDDPAGLEADTTSALADLRALSADFMDGRQTGTQGAVIARSYISDRFAEIGLQPAYGADYARSFRYTPRRASEETDGINLVGMIEGREDGPVLVVTAHYDHMGNCAGEICNGADDNASGVAAMIAIAAAFQNQQPQHDIYFAALDAEEVGLHGAIALVDDFPVPIARVALNINLDMLAINADYELPAAGAFHFPFLSERIERAGAVAPTNLIQGYDSPEWGPNGDWTYSSDHAAFHRAGIPWIYYGVDFHEHYHQPTDEFAVVQQDFFASNVQTVMNAVQLFDSELESVIADLAEMRASAPEPLGRTEAGSMRKPGME